MTRTPVLNVYAELYRLLGVEPPDSAGRDKPPCCDENTDLPPVLGAAVTELVDRAAKVRRTRRQPASLPEGGTAVEQGYGQKLALFVTCRRLALQSREVIGHKGTVVSRSVTGLCKLDVRHPPYLHRRSGRQGSHSGSCRTGRSVRHHADTLVGRRRPNLVDMPMSERCTGRVFMHSHAYSLMVRPAL